MSNTLVVTVATAVLMAPLVAALEAQKPEPPTPPPSTSPIVLTGCVSATPDASGRYTFAGADGVTQYRLKGSKLSKFAGQWVELAGGTTNGGPVGMRGGLVGPLAGARGVALDPSQESVKRQPGGGGAGIGAEFPEFRVARVKTAGGGTCDAPPPAR
jgi:hypothetical protein